MEKELISKKDLLELAEISYGQLYRWERKMLIPEDWFIRKSTFTGQETFFPKDQILARIEKIKNMKDDRSLDQLADMFSPIPAEITIHQHDLEERNIVMMLTYELYVQWFGKIDVFTFERLLYLYVLDLLLQTGEMSQMEGKSMMMTLQEHYKQFDGKRSDLILLRKMGMPVCLLVPDSQDVYFDPEVKVVMTLNMNQCVEELKAKLL